MKRLLLAGLLLALIVPMAQAQGPPDPKSKARPMRVILEDGAPFLSLTPAGGLGIVSTIKLGKVGFNFSLRAPDECCDGSCGPPPPGCFEVPQQASCTTACGTYCSSWSVCTCDAGYNGTRNLNGFCNVFECSGPWWAFC